MDDLSERVAVVTGAASGIGRAVGEAFATEGMRVVLADIDADGLAAACAELEAKGHEVFGVPTDVSSEDDIDRLAVRTDERYGRIDVVHNNAGVVASGLIEEISIDGVEMGPRRRPLERGPWRPHLRPHPQTTRLRAHHQHCVNGRPPSLSGIGPLQRRQVRRGRVVRDPPPRMRTARRWRQRPVPRSCRHPHRRRRTQPPRHHARLHGTDSQPVRPTLGRAAPHARHLTRDRRPGGRRRRPHQPVLDPHPPRLV